MRVRASLAKNNHQTEQPVSSATVAILQVLKARARHSDPRLTFNTYARTFDETEQKAVTFLPNFGDFVLSTCLDKIYENKRF
jgi:hypothetical protein